MATASRFDIPSPIRGWAVYPALAAIAAIALGLRLHLVGRNGLWLDEGVSIAIADLPWSDFFKVLWRREGNMAFYYLLLRGWSSLGESEFVLRMLSVVCGVAAIIAIWALGRRLFGNQAGLVAALLLTVNAFHIRYSQQARGYSLLMLLLILSSYFLVCVLEEPTKRNRRLYIAASVLAFYAHFFAILAIAAHLVAAFLFDRERARAARLARIAAWITGVCAPGILFLLLKNQGQLDWIPPLTWHSLYDSIVLAAGQGGWWLVLVYAVICAVAVVSFLRSRDDAKTRFGYALAISWLLIPAAILLVASFVKPLFIARYLAVCLPAMALLAAAGLQMLKPPVRMLALALLLMLSLLGVRQYYSGLPSEAEQWRELTQYVVSKSARDDGLVFDNGVARAVFEYYRGEATSPRVLFPAHGDKHTYRDFEGVATPQMIAAHSASNRRVWLIMRAASPALEQAMMAQFLKADEREFRGATVQLYVKPPR